MRLLEKPSILISTTSKEGNLKKPDLFTMVEGLVRVAVECCRPLVVTAARELYISVNPGPTDPYRLLLLVHKGLALLD